MITHVSFIMQKTMTYLKCHVLVNYWYMSLIKRHVTDNYWHVSIFFAMHHQ